MKVLILIYALSYLCNDVVGKIQQLIYYGDYAKIGKFPYTAHLGILCYMEKKKKIPWICGSSILNQALLLTAAHCLETCRSETEIVASVGHERIMKGGVSTGHSFVLHENYDDEVLNHDIALVRLKTHIRFSSNVSRVALSKKLRPFTNKDKALVAGWGISEKGSVSARLKYVPQYVWSQKLCIKLLDSMNPGTFCASSDDGYAAEGDSGSGLVIHGYLQIGLVSYKTTLYQSIIVYTNTGFYNKWIMKESKKLMCIK
ncbi:chymotrypsin-1-like [Anticarsia gemmatalis]|uniref:chymotrypsin-1-like n=1 Tax=Anticarsia gemmatalis TaxID=129554 RepID=UPI003F75ECB9